MKAVVAPLREFPPGERRLLEIGGRSIGVFRVGDRFYAIRNRCPHQGGPLCLGHILGAAVAEEPGAARIAANPLRIACPWHGWEYDLQSGQSFIGGAMPGVRSYAVALAPGRELAEELGAGRARLMPGPYKAETFPVSVEDDYVVVEV
jgi:nitrite reductase/ring-hydroxylating ferredoxin subunit